MPRDYLVDLLDAYWFAPPVALWRAIELRAAARTTFRSPLLDLGCGDGLVGHALFGTQGSVYAGLDPWMAQLERAAELGVYRHVHQGLGHALPYRDRCFATVFSNSVLEHIPDPDPVLREVSRVLRLGGQFVFTVPSDAFRRMLDGYWLRLSAGDPQGAESYANAVDEQLEHHHYHAPDEWEIILSRAGMVLLHAEYYMPLDATRLWDRVDKRFGGSRRLGRPMGRVWRALASPRFRSLGHQRLLRRLVVAHFGRRWRPYYLMELELGAKGGGLVIVAQRKERT